MKIEIYVSEPSLLNEVIQALANQQLIDKVGLKIQRETFQQKPSPRHAPIKIRTCYVERGGNNSLLCSACGRTIPVNHSGEIDMVSLAREFAILPRKKDHRNKHQQSKHNMVP